MNGLDVDVMTVLVVVFLVVIVVGVVSSYIMFNCEN